MKYRAKPNVVNAIRLPPDGEPTQEEVDEFQKFTEEHKITDWFSEFNGVTIHQDNTILIASDGDWIVVEETNKVLVMQNADFARHFEPVQE